MADIPHTIAYSRSVLDVVAERARQVTAEGWTPQHDDQHDAGTLAAAGCAYALAAADRLNPHSHGDGDYDNTPPSSWPWSRRWWKPGVPRRMLVKAAALLIGEIARIDRSEAVRHCINDPLVCPTCDGNCDAHHPTTT